MFVKKNYPIIILFVLSVIISLLNYNPGTFLSGWDTLHPEFNFDLNINRVISGVFREEQGLGAVAAHSHMADLPRILILYLLHFIFPLESLRYLYIFSNLVIGPIGMYFFLYKVVVRNKISSFLGGLFYLLNLGTLQQFIVPFEMFTTQYAFLPWLFLFSTQYLYAQKESGKKALLLFSLFTFLATPMAYAATLWYVYFAVLLLFLFSLSYPNLKEKSWHLPKKALLLIILTLALNSFWILPNFYFLSTHGSEVAQANINKLFSPQAFLYNKEFGNIKDISLLKSFLFDWGIYAGYSRFDHLLLPWINHLKNPLIQLIGFLFTGTMLAGLIYTIRKRANTAISFLPVFIFSLFFLINDNPPASLLYKFLQDKMPLFREGFRFPDDKVLIIFTFVFTIYFAYGQNLMQKLVLSLARGRLVHLQLMQTLVFSSLMLIFMLPAFNGNLISQYMRVQIPNNYFQMFNWFNRQNDLGKVANLPINSFWGWEYYDWYNNKASSFQGAGFLWFGIKQPMLHRDFDRWSPYNEQYYKEMSYAIYSKNPILLKSVVKKYNISYILLDTSIIAPETHSNVLFYKEAKKLLESSDFVNEKIKFGKNLFVYKLKNTNKPLLKNLSSAGPEAKSIFQDFAYLSLGNYITYKNSQKQYFPLRNIIDNQNRVISRFINDEQQGVTIKFNNKDLVSLPSFMENEDFLSSDVVYKKTDNLVEIFFYPRLPFNDTYHNVSPVNVKMETFLSFFVLSINQKYNFILNDTNNPISLGRVFLNTKNDNFLTIYPLEEQKIDIDLSEIQYSLSSCEPTIKQDLFGVDLADNNFSLFAKNSTVCMTIPLKNIFQAGTNQQEQLLSVTFDFEGKSNPNVCVANLKTEECISYPSKDYHFGIKPKDFDQLGLKLSLDGTQTNEMERVRYKNLSVSLTDPITSESFSSKLLSESIQNVQMTQSNFLSIPFSGDYELSKNIIVRPKTVGPCEISPHVVNKSAKKQTITNKNQNYIRYSSEEGSICDHFSYPSLSQKQSYLIVVNSRNITGLPLTMCVLNQSSRHCDIYANLTNSSTFTKDFFLLPAMHNEGGFDININNLAIKGTPSLNDLESIQIIPFPYNFISQIQTPDSENIKKQNIITLPYSFEEGWKAYQIKNYESGIKNYIASALPFIFGKELKEQVLVNNWTNGWIVDNSTIKQSNNETIVFLFLPQYLEYLGFIILIVTIASLLYLTFVITTDATKRGDLKLNNEIAPPPAGGSQ